VRPVVSQLPYLAHKTKVETSFGVSVWLQPRQIVVFVAVTPPRALAPAVDARVFPAVLDTGFAGDLAIQENQLEQWGGLQPSGLPCVGSGALYHDALLARLLLASIWLFPNTRGTLTHARESPQVIEAHVLVVPDALQPPEERKRRPRLPILGLHALERAGLRVIIDTRQRTVDIEAPD
jgi:hypothetical protein